MGTNPQSVNSEGVQLCLA